VVHSEALEVLRKMAKKPVFSTALPLLQPGTELALRLDERVEFALFWRDGEAQVEERTAQADVEFAFSGEALRRLETNPAEQLAAFGIAIIEQIIAGEMRLKVRGSLWRLATAGYLQIILAAGPELLTYLAQHGLTSSKKILDLMRSLKG
jgi:hypothetical protein